MKDRVTAILAGVKRLSCEYYALTGKPLGVTGEVAEFDAAEILGLELAPARTAAYDAIRRVGEAVERIQIKGRAVPMRRPASGLGASSRPMRCSSARSARPQRHSTLARYGKRFIPRSLRSLLILDRKRETKGAR
jgi:hypothetical protein